MKKHLLAILLLCCYVATTMSGTVKVYNFSTNSAPLGFKILRNGTVYWTPAELQNIGPGQSGTSPDNANLNGFTITVRDSTPSAYYATPTNGLTGGGTFYYFGAPSAPTNCSVSFNLSNPNPYPLTYYATKNGTIQYANKVTIQPGGTGNMVIVAPCNQGDVWNVIYFTDYDPLTLRNLHLDVPPTPPSGNTNYAPLNPQDNTPASFNPTNNPPPIVWGASTNDTRSGFDALFDAISKFSAQNDANLRYLRSNINTPIISNIVSVLASNNVSVSFTNNASFTNIFAITNLDQTYSFLTNLFTKTNVSSEAEGLIAGAGENALEHFDSAKADIDEIIGTLGSGNTSLGGGGPDVFQFSFMGSAMNADPVAAYPSLFVIAKALLTFVVLYFFISDISKLFYSMSQDLSRAQVGGVPNLEAATFNIHALSLTAIVAIAICVAFAALFVAVFSIIWTYVGQLMAAGTGLTVYTGAAYYLLDASTPVALILGICWVRLIVMFTASGILALAAAALRFMPGH